MSHIDVFYEGNFTTRALHEESGMEVKTNMATLSPTDVYASSLGSCLLTIMALSAQKLGVDLQGAKVRVFKEMTKTPPRKILSLEVDFFCPAKVSSEIALLLEQAAKNCPIHHSLHPDIQVTYRFKWGAS